MHDHYLDTPIILKKVLHFFSSAYIKKCQKKVIESVYGVIDRIVDSEPSDNKIIEYGLETPEDKINRVKRIKTTKQ